MRKLGAAEVRVGADVVRFLGAELVQERDQILPVEVRVCFDEKIPRCVGSHAVGLEEHVDEFVFV